MFEGRRERPRGHRPDRGAARAVEHRHPGPGDPPVQGDEAPEEAARPGRALGGQDVPAPEGWLAPADGPAEPRLHRGDLQGQLVPVQRVAQLRAQGVPRTEPAGQPPAVPDGVQERVPQLGQVPGRRDELVAPLAGVTGAAHRHRSAVPDGLDEREVGVTDRQAEAGEHLVAPGTLDGENAQPLVQVGDLDRRRDRCRQPTADLGAVGRVGHQQDVVGGPQVHQEVVDDAPGPLVAAQRVLGPARPDPVQGVGQGGVHQRGGTGPGDRELAEVAHVEQPHAAPHRPVLAEHAAPVVLDRHVPPAEVAEPGAQRLVPVRQGGPQQPVHPATVPVRPVRTSAA